MSNSSIWPVAWSFLGATTPGQSVPGSDSNEGVPCITGAWPSDRLLSYQDAHVRSSSLSTEMQSVNSTAPANWNILAYSYFLTHRNIHILYHLLLGKQLNHWTSMRCSQRLLSLIYFTTKPQASITQWESNSLDQWLSVRVNCYSTADC